MSAGATPSALSEDDRRVLQSLAEGFDRDWSEERIREWIEDIPPGDRLWLPAVVVLVRADLIRRWQRGVQTTLEWYLENWPQLGTAETAPADLVFAEYDARRRAGAPRDLADFARRFPQQADALRQKVERLESRKGDAGTGSSPELKTRHSRTGSSPRNPASAAAAPQTGRGSSPDAKAQKETEANTSATRPASTAGAHDLAGRFGRYEIVRKLGEGGMGAVYLARDTQLDREVALKVPRFSVNDGPEVLERFLREARAAATMHHPNLCPVHDVGEIDGKHYLTMAYIDGRPLSHYIAVARQEEKPLPERHAAGVVRKIALALEDAHRKGVVHRDLKPANVMIDSRKEPVIMDFGLARRGGAEDARITQSGVVVGTPAYMPPEQVLGELERIGPPCDIYALGVILYELLCGQLPFRGPVAAVLGQIIAVEPEPPSKHRPGLDPSLEAICQKAMAKKIEDRYPSMAAFAAALTDWIRRPGSASATTSGVGGTLAAAARVPESRADADEEAGVAAQMFAALAASSPPPPAVRSMRRPRNSQPTRLHEPIQQRVRRGWSGLSRNTKLAALGFAIGVAVVLAVVLLVSTPKGTIRLELSDSAADVTVTVDGDTVEVAGLDQPLTLRVGEHELEVNGEGFETVAQTFTVKEGDNRVLRIDLVPIVETGGGGGAAMGGEFEEIGSYGKHLFYVTSIACSPDGRYVLSGDNGGKIHLWEFPSGKLVTTLLGHSDGVFEVAFTADGTHALSASGGRYLNGPNEFGSYNDRSVRYWEVPSGRQVQVFSLVQSEVAVADDGRKAAAWGKDKMLHLLDLRSGSDVVQLPAHDWGIGAVAFVPGSSLVFTAANDVRLWNWDTASQRRVLSITQGDHIRCMTVSADGTLLLAGSEQGLLYCWDVASGDQLWKMPAHSDRVTGVAFTPDGTRFVSSSFDAAVRVWETTSRKSLGRFPGHTGAVSSVAVTPDGRHALSGGFDRTVRMWRLPEAPPSPDGIRPPPADAAVANVAGDWQPLFSGTDLSGWQILATSGANDDIHRPGLGGWEVRGGEIRCTSSANNWLRTDRQYGDFELELEYKLPASGNSGVYIRAPDAGRMARAGMEVQLLDPKLGASAPPDTRTASIHRAAAPSTGVERPAGQWNHLRVRCVGDLIEIALNGTVVTRADMGQVAELKDRPRSGYIGLANWHGQANGAAFRNVRLREL